ncbi:MAG: hypothetical protein ACETVW_02405 [Dehalococcoidia bacterium]
MKDKTKEQDTNALEGLRQKLGGFEILETGLKLAGRATPDSGAQQGNTEPGDGRPGGYIWLWSRHIRSGA